MTAERMRCSSVARRVGSPPAHRSASLSSHIGLVRLHSDACSSISGSHWTGPMLFSSLRCCPGTALSRCEQGTGNRECIIVLQLTLLTKHLNTRQWKRRRKRRGGAAHACAGIFSAYQFLGPLDCVASPPSRSSCRLPVHNHNHSITVTMSQKHSSEVGSVSCRSARGRGLPAQSCLCCCQSAAAVPAGIHGRVRCGERLHTG